MARVMPFGAPCRGQYRLTAMDEGRWPGETENHVVATLDNWGERCSAVILPESDVKVWELREQQIVFVTGRRRKEGAQEIIDVQALYPLPVDLVENGALVLPGNECPPRAREALARLVRLNEEIDPPALRDFLTRVLLDPTIGVPFMQAPAACSYHHAYPGGLMVHSTEMLDWARVLGHIVEPGFPLAPSLVQMGYLLHDLGKVDTIHGGPVLANAVQHEVQTFVRLGRHLAWLENQWPEGAQWLSVILGYCARSPKERRHDAWMGAQAVVFLDRLSTSRDCRGNRVPFRLPDPPGYEPKQEDRDDE